MSPPLPTTMMCGIIDVGIRVNFHKTYITDLEPVLGKTVSEMFRLHKRNDQFRPKFHGPSKNPEVQCILGNDDGSTISKYLIWQGGLGYFRKMFKEKTL